MQKDARDFLERMLATPSPSGFEQPVQRIIREHVQSFADRITTDVHGNTVAAVNPEGTPRVMLAGHVDQIGFMVRFINDKGFVHFGPIGGIDAGVVPGLSLTVHTSRGPVEGVVGRKPVHLMKPEERTKAKVEIPELWLDIGARDKKAAERLVAVGDPITYRLGCTRLQGDLVAAAGLDDKAGAFCVMEALRLVKQARKKCRCAVFAVSTVQEELGLRGARTSCFGLDPQVGIAVDMTHASDYPGANKKLAGELSLGKGPVIAVGPNINPALGELMRKTARARKIAVQIEGAPRATGTDANAIQISRAGVAAGLVSVATRYMHTPVEVVSLQDVERASRLLAETCLRITPAVDFIPA